VIIPGVSHSLTIVAAASFAKAITIDPLLLQHSISIGMVSTD
jgi:hypothetical protein